VVVQHQAVEVAKAVVAVKDAKDQLKQAEQDYRQYQKELNTLETQLATLESDYANDSSGVDYNDLQDMQVLVTDLKDDDIWYQSAIVLATPMLPQKSRRWHSKAQRRRKVPPPMALTRAYNWMSARIKPIPKSKPPKRLPQPFKAMTSPLSRAVQIPQGKRAAPSFRAATCWPTIKTLINKPPTISLKQRPNILI
jgi:hypothetical protein